MNKTYFRLLAILILLSLPLTQSHAQMAGRFEPGYYRPPMDGRMYLSANFAEARTDHLHSGIDVKTGGVEGRQLYSVADGYIARVNIAPKGYGRAIYIAHPNGTTTVYAHMQKFTPEIEEYISNHRHATKRHSGDMYIENTPRTPRFPVKQGDLIGYSGNSGSSTGPHLHFEIRQTASQRILNVPALRIYDLKDNIPPTIVRLHYIEVDTVRGVPMNSAPRAIDVMSTGSGNYKLAQGTTLELGKCGYFVVESTDRKNDTHNTMGIYSVRMTVDGKPHFAYSTDSFLFDESRYVNSLTHYGMQKGSRNEFLRLAVQANNQLPIYRSVWDRGAVCLPDNTPKDVAIELEDDNGNISRIAFKVKLRGDGRVFNPDAPEGSKIADCRKLFLRSRDGLDIIIPANALYENMFFTQSSAPAPAGAKMKCYSPIHTVHNEQTPLHRAATISIDVGQDVPVEIRPKLCFARVMPNGNYNYSAARYENGKVTGQVRNFGRYTVVADTTPPTIAPSFAEGENLTGKDSITFTLRDDFSGIASFTADIDGQWIPFEEQRNVITHRFADGRVQYNGNPHTLSITVTDNKGNSTTLKRTFVR